MLLIKVFVTIQKKENEVIIFFFGILTTLLYFNLLACYVSPS